MNQQENLGDKNCRRNNPDVNAEECWNFWKCSDEYKKKCPAHIYKMGNECWMIVGSFVQKPRCPLVRKEFKSCLECPWFILKHPETTDTIRKFATE